ncbi:hypothetical protein D3C87_1407850 [compost metagenome]
MQVDDLAMSVEPQADRGVAGVKASKTWHQPEGGESGGGGYRQARNAALRTQGVDALRNFQQGAVQAVE